MYTFDLKPNIGQKPLALDAARLPLVRTDQAHPSSTHNLQSIKDVLGYFEPDAVQCAPPEPAPHAIHAIFILDSVDRVRRKNYLAEELLAEQQLFSLAEGRLVPFLRSETPYWDRSLASVRRMGKARFVILAGLHNRFAVGLCLRSQGDIEVHIETGLKIREEVLQVFCDSTGITSCEKEVLRWVLVGLKPKAIAHIRSRSEATVRSHVKNALAKSGCSSVPELIAMVTRLPDFA
jgi:DNA-binding CsgD family transcriptional regulator